VNKSREQHKTALLDFLRTIQKAGVPIQQLGENERLVASGLIDSLAILQIISYLETNYGIDFSEGGINPEQLASIGSILDLIEQHAK
jgi:acyl carrier protein